MLRGIGRPTGYEERASAPGDAIDVDREWDSYSRADKRCTTNCKVGEVRSTVLSSMVRRGTCAMHDDVKQGGILTIQ